MFVYFEDAQMSKPLQELDLGEVKAGETTELTVYALNICAAELRQIEFIPNDPDLKITANTSICKPRQIIMLNFVFTPSVDRETALEAGFTIKASGVIRAKSR